NRPCFRVDQGPEVTVITEWAKHRLPGIPLLAGSPAVSARPLVVHLLLHRAQDNPIDIPVAGYGHLCPPFFAGPGIRPVINIDGLKEMKVDRVRAIRERSAKEIWIKDLKRQGFPSSGRAPGQYPCIRLADGPESRLDVRNQLLCQRLTIGPCVG